MLNNKNLIRIYCEYSGQQPYQTHVRVVILVREITEGNHTH